MLQENWTIDRKDTGFTLEDDSRGEIRFVEPHESARTFAGAYDRLCRLRPGMIDRNDLLWEVALLDTDEFRRGASEFYHAVYEESGRVDGYVLYRLDGRGHSCVSVSWSRLRLGLLPLCGDSASASTWMNSIRGGQSAYGRAVALDVEGAAPVAARDRRGVLAEDRGRRGGAGAQGLC